MSRQSETGDLLTFLGVVFALIAFSFVGFGLAFDWFLTEIGVMLFFVVIVCMILTIVADERWK